MALVTRTAVVDLDSWFSQPGFSAGNGKGPRMYVGRTTVGSLTGPNRFAIRIPRGTLFDGVPNADLITAFDLLLRTQGGCDGNGTAIRLWAERATTALGENATTTDCGVSSAGAGNSVLWPGPDTVEDDRATYSGGAPSGWVRVTALALGKWWFAHPEVTGLVVVFKAASSDLSALDEANTARRWSVYSRHTSSAPYAEMSFNNNLAPYAPSDLSPEDGALSSSTAGTSVAVTGRHLDPEGNAATKYQAQLFASGTTDEQADLGAVRVKDETITATTAHAALRTHTFAGVAARTSFEWRIRFYDGQWGPWSLLRTITSAYKPTAVNLRVEPGTTTPKLYASIQSSDPGDYITAVDEFIYQDPATGTTITKWAPPGGHVEIGGSPNTSEVTYGGTTLLEGTQYRRRVVIYNRDGIPSDLTANTYFTPRAPVGPDVVPGDISTKLNTTQPTITLSDPGLANIDQKRVEWLDESGEVVLHDTGVVGFTSAASSTVQAPAGIYAAGQRPRGRAYIRITGQPNMGPARDFQLHLNSKPGAPYPTTVSGGQTVQRADGVWVTTDSTPDILFPFIDADEELGYTEAMTRQEVELRTAAEAHVAGSPFVDTTSPTELFTSPALTVEQTYHARARVDDNGALRSDFSEYAYIKYSAAPVLSAVTPANAATVTDPSPDWAWTYSHSGGSPQAAWRLQVLAGSTELYDTDWTPGTAATAHMPAFILPNATVITWTLSVRNADGLVATVTRTFTTAFTVPAALTSLTVTAEDEDKALLAIWSQSALPTNEFEAYIVEARTEGGQFRRVAYIVDKQVTAFRYLAAAHNRETIIRVRQTNGWMESPAIEESATLTAEGYWMRTASRLVELAHVTGHGGDTVADKEIYEPPGRGEPLVLHWGARGYEGKFTLMTNDQALIDELRGWKDAGELVMFKHPRGAVRYAFLTATPDSDAVADWANLDGSYIEVAASSAAF
jgi:hypothetical protein